MDARTQGMGMKPEPHVGDTCIRQQGLHPALRPDAAKQPRAGVNNALRPATAISGHVPVRDFLSSVYKACKGGDGVPTAADELTPGACRGEFAASSSVPFIAQRRHRERERERERICFFIMHARTQACVVNDRKSRLDVRLRCRSCKHWIYRYIARTRTLMRLTFNYSRLNFRLKLQWCNEQIKDARGSTSEMERRSLNRSSDRIC